MDFTDNHDIDELYDSDNNGSPGLNLYLLRECASVNASIQGTSVALNANFGFSQNAKVKWESEWMSNMKRMNYSMV